MDPLQDNGLESSLDLLVEEMAEYPLADWLRPQLPEWLLEVAFYLEAWQWMALALLAFLGILADRIFVLVVLRSFRQVFRRDPELVKTLRRSLRPFGLLVMGLLWWYFVERQLGLKGNARGVLTAATKFVALLASVWGAFRLVDLLTDILASRARRTATKLDDLLIPLIRKTVKVFIFAFGLVFIADNLGTDITSVLAGLGLGGLAFALAAQDTVRNLFGTLTVLLDRTYNVGDWIKMGDVEGTVEHVGFRSTRVRTFYNSLLTVPNSQVLTSAVDNLGQRRYRRYKTTLALTYGTPPERIEAFCEGVGELIRRHPYTRKDYYHCYLNGFGAASLDVLLYMFHEAPDWGTELRERQRLMLDILRLAQKLGVEFAFPTQTLYLQRPEGPGEPPPLSADAVREARSEGRLAAQGLVEATLGRPAAVPPPVNFSVSPEENRGEGE